MNVSEEMRLVWGSVGGVGGMGGAEWCGVWVVWSGVRGGGCGGGAEWVRWCEWWCGWWCEVGEVVRWCGWWCGVGEVVRGGRWVLLREKLLGTARMKQTDAKTKARQCP